MKHRIVEWLRVAGRLGAVTAAFAVVEAVFVVGVIAAVVWVMATANFPGRP